jgi:hypothetical protein
MDIVLLLMQQQQQQQQQQHQHQQQQQQQTFKFFFIKLPRYILRVLIQCNEGRQTFVFLFRHVGRATAPGQYNDQNAHSYLMGMQSGLTRPGLI